MYIHFQFALGLNSFFFIAVSSYTFPFIFLYAFVVFIQFFINFH